MTSFPISDVKEGTKIIREFPTIIFRVIKSCSLDNYVGRRLNSDGNFGYTERSLN